MSNNQPVVMITGAGGFLGFHLVLEFLKHGWQVMALHRPGSKGRLELIPEGITVPDKQSRAVRDGAYAGLCVQPCDITDSVVFERLIRGHGVPDLLINCAAAGVNPAQRKWHIMHHVNVHGALNMFKGALNFRIPAFFHIGSCFELLPDNFYGATKRMSSLIISYYSAMASYNGFVIRPFNLWGPLEGEWRLMPTLINARYSTKQAELCGRSSIRDFLYVRDAARYIVEIAELTQRSGAEKGPTASEAAAISGAVAKPSSALPLSAARGGGLCTAVSGAIIDLGRGEGCSVQDFVSSVTGILNSGSGYDNDSLKISWRDAAERPECNVKERLVADISCLERLLPGRTYTSIEEGVQQTVVWRQSI